MEDAPIPNTDQVAHPETAAEGQVATPVPAAPSVAPSVPEAGETDATPSDGVPHDAGPVRRGMKLVVTLRPNEGGGYRAVLALGADGCDPLLRAAEVNDLPAVLDEVPALLADAETRWAEQPRNAAAHPARPARAPGAIRGTPVSAAPPEPTHAQPATPAQATGPGQLALFG